MAGAFSIVDPHIHLWDLSTGLYPHFEKPAPDGTQFSTYALADFLDESGPDITGAVHVEAFPTDPVRETSVIQTIADESPFPILMVGNADLSVPDFETALDQHAAYPVFRGIRQVVNLPDARHLLELPVFTQNMRLLGKRAYSFDLQLLPAQMETAAAIAGACPDTVIVVNHAGLWADRDFSGWQQWKRGMKLLAERDNVWVKISGLGMMDRNWTTESIRPQVYEILEFFGTGRALFASNFPVDRAISDYAAIWRAFDAVTASLTPTERDLLFAGNARTFYRFPAPEPTAIPATGAGYGRDTRTP